MRIDITTLCGKIKYIVATGSKIIAIYDTYKEAENKKLCYDIK